MIEETRHPQTNVLVISVTCDGDAECPDSQFFPEMHGMSDRGLTTVGKVMARYGWEVVVKRPPRTTVLDAPLVEAYCPAHATNPPPAGYSEPVKRMGAPYGPGTEGFYSR